MRSIIRGLTVAGALGLATISLEAQGGPPAGRPDRPGRAAQAMSDSVRQQMRPGARMQAMAIRRRAAARGVDLSPRQVRDRIVAQRAVARERIRNMTPEQRAAFRVERQALQAERESIGAQLRAGTITREQARARMEAWRREHRPNAALRGPKPPRGGY